MSALDVQIGGNHYKDCRIQPVEFIEANGIKFLEGCVIKRVTRHDKPSGKGRQDIEKAIHELQLLLQLRYGVEPPVVAFDPAAPRADVTKAATYTGAVLEGVEDANAGRVKPLAEVKAQYDTKAGPDAEGWVRHNGGACPLVSHTLVDVVLRNGSHIPRILAGEVSWSSEDSGAVVRYRLSVVG